MAFTKFILPALALAGTALAQGGNGNNCPDTDNGVFTIQSQGDAARLQNCQNFDGTVRIASTVAGNLELNGVEQISGNLSCFNATGLTSISTDQLNSIGGTLGLNGLTILSNLQMSSLTKVDLINFEALPALQELSFNQGVQTARGVRIVNTDLTTLNGIELQEVGALEVTNNPFLTDFNVNDLSSITEFAIIVSNAPALDIKFPNLESAANLTFGNVSSLAIPSLANVTGSLGCYSNMFETFSAPNLTTVGNALVFDDNSNLKNVSVPSVTKVGGGFQIENNTKLASIDGFDDLKTIGGAVTFIGAFKNISLPSVTQISGAINVNSTADLDCTALANALKSSRAKNANNHCNSAQNSKSSGSSSSSSSSSGSSSSSKPTNAASPVEINTAAMGLFGALAGLLVI